MPLTCSPDGQWVPSTEVQTDGFADFLANLPQMPFADAVHAIVVGSVTHVLSTLADKSPLGDARIPTGDNLDGSVRDILDSFISVKAQAGAAEFTNASLKGESAAYRALRAEQVPPCRQVKGQMAA